MDIMMFFWNRTQKVADFLSEEVNNWELLFRQVWCHDTYLADVAIAIWQIPRLPIKGTVGGGNTGQVYGLPFTASNCTVLLGENTA